MWFKLPLESGINALDLSALLLQEFIENNRNNKKTRGEGGKRAKKKGKKVGDNWKNAVMGV